METSRSPQDSQNCFMPAGTRKKAISVVGNETYLYDEAEPLMYVCSETSMPPKSSGNIRALKSADTSATGKGSPSKTSSRKSRTSSTLVYESGERQASKKISSPRSAEGRISTEDAAQDFKRQILKKLEEFAIRPNSSCSNLEEGEARSKNTDTNERCLESKSQAIEEIFIRNTRFLATSSESQRVRISSEELQDEVFSTGISDMEEGVNQADITRKSENTASSMANTIGLPQWFTKSIVKNVNANTERPAPHTSPNRIGPPVQGKLSLRTMKATPPCFCLLDEIRKNNLVMNEDIISSSSHKEGPLGLTARMQNTGGSSSNIKDNSKDRMRMSHGKVNTRPAKQQTSAAAAVKAINPQLPLITTEDVVVYETTGKNNGADATAEQKQGPNLLQDTVASGVNALAVNIHLDRKRLEEFWRPFNLPNQKNGRESLNEGKERSLHEEKSLFQDPKAMASFDSSCDDHQSFGTDDLTSERNLNEYLDANPSTTNRRPERYVRLPGLADTFFRQDSNFKGLRIRDGLSFKSINALEEIAMRNKASQMKNMNEYRMRTNDIASQILQSTVPNGPVMVTKKKIITETKDAATDFQILSKNTKTQTGNWEKSLVDCSVQCESHIVDEAYGRTNKNDYKEIMVCNDNGDGVQLYNELGHPLTDMDGYLLKDSLGRFLVTLDRFGIPISCTNGHGIFMEDSTPWDAVKSNMSIIHQTRKKLIKRDNGVKKGKARPSLRQLETAMRNLKNTLGLVNTASLESSNEDLLEKLAYFQEHSPRRSIGTAMDATKLNNNTTSLLAEMNSIARLRNALLEKVNFIADNRNKFEKLGKQNKLLGRKKSPNDGQQSFYKNWADDKTSIWEGQNRPFSPTYQAIKKLRGSETDNWMNREGARMTQDHTTYHKNCGHKKNSGVDLRVDTVNGTTLGGSLSKEETSRGNQLKTDSWISALPGSSLNTNFPVYECTDENVLQTDLWSLINEKSKGKFNTRTTEKKSDDNFLISQSNRYRELDKELERLDMNLVSKGMENPPGFSGYTNVRSKESAFAGSQLLISLEKQYNLREGSSCRETWKVEDSSVSSRVEKNSRHRTEQARIRSEMKPSIEFSSSCSNNFF